ncbi:MAG: cobalamin biosynthesis protein [Chloroflexota bacterium]
MDILIISLLAVGVDWALGEPKAAVHPVVWMGKVIFFLERFGGFKSNAAQFCYGLGMVLVTLGLFISPVYFALSYLRPFSLAGYLVLGALLLKTTISLRKLGQVALRVERLLQADKLDEARFELRSLVSRDTQGLSKPQLVSATVESVAENTCDSVIAPLFYFVLLGVPGAIAYRVVNTMDAMIGYHGKYEYLGKFASRLDDMLNFIPARLTALLLALAAFLSRRNGRASWRVALREHARTESPNAGWPMAAIAGALDVQLEKVGSYKLGQAGKPLVPETVDASWRLALIAMLSWVSICAVAGVVYFVTTT